MATSLYIHIPFCDQICSYCDFPKLFTKNQNIDEYIDALLIELEIYKKKIGFSKLKTIYIGGGTPTVLSKDQLIRLFNYLHNNIDFTKLVEVSIESNPESLNCNELIACLLACGVTRISIGVQTLQKKLLKILERNHSKEDIIDVIHKLSTANVEINIDMIYAIPTQTIHELEDDINTLLSLPITHISAYSLILEEHTKFYKSYLNDELDLLDNDLEAQMFEKVIHSFKKAGYQHYEISNFTRDKRSYHNETYWKNLPYIAVGLGAHGQIIQNNSCMRYENTRSINAYKKALVRGELPVTNARVLTRDEQIEESMFLGLRMMEGIDLAEMSTRYKTDVYAMYEKKIKKLLALKLVTYEDFSLMLTDKGIMLANEVFEEMLL